MNNLEIAIETRDGEHVGFQQYSPDEKVYVKSADMFKQSLQLIENVTNSFVSKIKSLQNPPDEFDVEFGIAFKADLGAIIAKTSAEANFKIALKWKNK